VRTPVRVALEGLAAGEKRLTGDAAHYLSRVHRLGRGACFSAFDPGARLEASAEVLAVDAGSLVCRFAEPQPARVVGDPGLTLIQCSAKGEKLDEVVRGATALGVSALVVAESARAIGRAGTAAHRRERWLAVALDAARQSGRGDLPDIAGPEPLDAVLARFTATAAHKLCLHPEGELGFGAALAERAGRALTLLVGPEGGFSPDELDAARAAGFALASFGELVLRTELAGIAALGAVLAARSSP
jgi:16S rRNA (uracil1498-N3)-methyltransferase